MKLPFVSRNKYEILEEMNDDLSRSLKTIHKIYDDEKEKHLKCEEEFKKTTKAMASSIDKSAVEINDLKAEVKRLKTLCTRNGISYEKKVTK